MDLPYASATWASLAGTVILVRLIPQYSPSESYVKTYFALFTLLFGSAILWKAILYPKCFSPLRHLPKPPGGTFLNGHWREIFMNRDPGRTVPEWMRTVPNDGLIYYTTFLNAERLVVTTPQGVHEVLQTNAYDYVKPPFVRRALLGSLGNGLVLAEGEEHKTQRRDLNPAFSYRHIKNLTPLFWSKAKELTDAFAAQVSQPQEASDSTQKDRSIVNVAHWFDRTTFDIIGLAGIGHDFGSLQNENSEFIQGYRKLFRPEKGRMLLFAMSFFLPQWFVRALPFAHNYNVKEGSNRIQKAAYDLMREKQEKLERGEKRTDIDILSVAFESGHFSPEALVNQAMTFLAAGHETSSTALIWSTLEACRHPEMQRRIREEVRSKLPSPAETKTIDPDLLGKCQYLAAFINEILRFHSPIAQTMRENIRPTKILGQHVPKGTQIIIPIWGANKSTDMWGPDADEFKPDRWLDSRRESNGGAKGPYGFMTFLQGPRSCIGSSFSRNEIMYIFAVFVGRFEMELADKDRPIEVSGGLTAKIKDGLEVRLTPLEGW